MGFVSPATQVTMTELTTAKVNAIKAGLDYLAADKPNGRAYSSAATAVSNNTRTAITLNSERWDTGAVHSTGSNTANMYAPTGEGGKYLFGGHGEWAAFNTTGIRQIELFQNAATIVAVQQVPGVNGLQDQSVSTLWSMAAGDYMQLTGLQTSGVALFFNAVGAYASELWGMWLST
jgi:hypothetical protein